LEVISQRTPIKEKIKFFEKKYGSSFDKFEREIKEEVKEKEDFQKWDDYIEWKAYIEKLKDLELKLKEIENAQEVKLY